MPDLALLSSSGPVATLTLNRVDARNALSLNLLDALHARITELESHTAITVLIVTGAGKAFCAGMDLKSVMQSRGEDARTGPLHEGGAGEGLRTPRPSVVRAPRQAKAVKQAKFFRKVETDAENALWQELRSKRLDGLKFRRQHPFGRFVLDFFCDEAGLAIELDGQSHLKAEAAQRDTDRTAWLAAHGVRLVRFPNDAVRDMRSLLRRIREEANARLGRNPPPPLPQGGEEDADDPLPLRLLMSLARVCLRLRRLPLVSIAKVNGAAIGGGCGLATVCDIAITHADSKMGFPEVDLGVCPAVVAPWLVRKVGAGRARQILLQGGVLTGQRAHELGIVNHIVPALADLDASTDQIAQRLATGGPNALRATKALLNDLDGSLDAALVQRGARLSAQVLSTSEAQAMLRAKLEKRE